jgi:sugar lactone lactonase YvrE
MTEEEPHDPIPSSITPGLLSEGPRWHAETGELLWVDIVGAMMHRSRPDADGGLPAPRTITVDRPVGAVAPDTDGGYVLAAGPGFLHVDRTGRIHELAQPDAENPAVRMNDGACDAQGRFWAGTMAYDETPGAGTLYRLELDGRCTTVLAGLTISNGIGWSPDGGTMYLADSGTRRIDAFDFDPVTGDITGRRPFVSIDEPAAPDGLTVDDAGGVWVALWDGGAVRRYLADGTLSTVVPLPVDRPTSCAFGGPDRATLYVTTARVGLDEQTLSMQPDAGRVLRVTGLGVTGPGCAAYRGRTTGGPASPR